MPKSKHSPLGIPTVALAPGRNPLHTLGDHGRDNPLVVNPHNCPFPNGIDVGWVDYNCVTTGLFPNNPWHLTIDGYWKAGNGPDFDWCGPGGNPRRPETYWAGCTAWSAVVIAVGQQNNGLWKAQYQAGMSLNADDPGPFSIWVFMNDDDYSDNSSHPSDPLRAYLS